MTPTHWLYPVNRSTDCVVRTLVGPESLTLDALRRADLDRPAVWALASGYRSMAEGDLLWVYFARPDQVVAAVGRVAAVQADDTGHWVLLEWDVGTTRALLEAPIPLASLGRAPRTVRRADEIGVAALRSWLQERMVA